ncbi:MAG TPA: tetratricopeptide repeat protein [Terriglobales bacterium]|nr:tetratricopeptide repeat protein [Terriglobales bacterium]
MALLSAVLLARPAAANSPLETGQQQFAAGRYREAAATLRAAADRQSGDARVQFWLARSYYELRDFENAVSSAERAVALESGNSEYHLWLGRAYGQKAKRAGIFSAYGLARKTREMFARAIQLDRRNLAAWRDLITYDLRAPGIAGGGDDKAKNEVEELERLDAVEGHLARAEYWQDQKRPDLAEAEYRKALELKPAGVKPYLEIAEFYATRQNGAALEQVVEAAVRVDARDPRLLFFRALAYVTQNQKLPDAEQLLKAYLSTVPPRSDRPSPAAAHELLGKLYEKQGKRQEAAAEFKAALRLEPKRKGASDALKALQP